MPTTDDLSRALRGSSLRVTGPRLAVLEAVHAHPHADTDTVLRALTDAGLVRRIEPAGSVARYEARTGDNHHHAVCRGCGAIADVDCAVGHAPCLTAADDSGYEIGEAEVIYWGRCPACAVATTSSGLAHSAHTQETARQQRGPT